MLLLQHGASVDSVTKDQYTSLHIAAKEDQEEVSICESSQMLVEKILLLILIYSPLIYYKYFYFFFSTILVLFCEFYEGAQMLNKNWGVLCSMLGRYVTS